MIAPDPFSQQYAALLSSTYDVVDRIVINAYFGLAATPGGFRRWWEQLHGTTDNLDDTHLMRIAGRFSRRLHAWAKKHGVPVVHCTSADRKHRVAAEHAPADPDFRGIFAVLVYRFPSPVWRVLRFAGGGFHIKRREPMPCVNHYAFQIMDPEWGHVVVQVSGHAPFRATVMLNGHEYTACRAGRAGLTFEKEGNCFTEVSDPQALARVADTLRSEAAVGRLRQVCERWIYTCLAFGLPLEDQRRSGFRYDYSVFQAEYSRNLLFRNGHRMERVFQGVVDRTRALLDAKRVLTIFGARQRRKVRGKPRRFEAALETPVYDLTVFKVHFGRLTLKVYTKGERVLRAEAIAHNAAELRCGRRLDRFAEVVRELSALLTRFLESLRCMDAAWVDAGELEALPRPGKVGRTRVGGVDVDRPRMRASLQAVLALSPSPRGFTAAEHAAKVRESLGPDSSHAARHSAYDLKKLRAKGLVRKTGPNARRYAATPGGLRLIAGLVVLRERVLRPLLAYRGRCKSGPKPHATAEIDHHYQSIQREMQNLLKHLNFVA